MCNASNPEQPPPQKENHILSLPEDIVLNCLARVPRNCNLNIAQVSKTLRTFVSSPELNRLRSLLHKNSLYVCLGAINEIGKWTYMWLTLEKTTNEYRLVPFPCRRWPFMDRYLAVSVGSDIYFLLKDFQYPSNFWILDTRAGKLSMGPNMKAVLRSKTMGVIDGKIYVMGFDRFDDVYKKIQVHAFDPKSKIWKSEGQEKMPPCTWYRKKNNIITASPPSTWYRNEKNIITASLELKIYRVEAGKISVYNPQEGEGERMVHMVSKRVLVESNNREGGRMHILDDATDWVCVVENVLYACHRTSGLMWLDTNVNIWRRVFSRYAVEVCRVAEHEVAEYEGKLAVFELIKHDGVDNTKSVKMFLFSFHRVGEKMLGTIEWSGIVTTDLSFDRFLHCFGTII